MTITKETILQHIFELSDEKYKDFHAGLVPGNNTIIGVRVPVLRQYAKELLVETDAQELLKVIGTEWYEERMLRGMVIGLQKKARLQMVLDQTKEFLPLIDNWAICDTFCAGLKIVKKNREEVYNWLIQFVESPQQYVRRFVLVMMMDYYIDEMYIERTLEVVSGISLEGYYVQMAAAWLLSVALVKQFDRTLDWMEKCGLDDFTYNKTLQKAIESYRITPEQKDRLRSYKRKKEQHV